MWGWNGGERSAYCRSEGYGIQWHLSVVDSVEQAQVTPLERCPYYRGSFVHISTRTGSIMFVMEEFIYVTKFIAYHLQVVLEIIPSQLNSLFITFELCWKQHSKSVESGFVCMSHTSCTYSKVYLKSSFWKCGISGLVVGELWLARCVVEDMLQFSPQLITERLN